MNETILKFLNKQSFEIEKLENLDGFRVYSDSDVNWIIGSNRVFKDFSIPKNICIADILGYDYLFRDLGKMSLFENFGHFFDKNGAGYERRSLSMLDYSTDEVVSKLSDSFKREPICLIEADKGKYTIGSNGLHRYHILKAHYLKELSSLNENNHEEMKSLREKYTFETRVSETDYFKTYSNYILKSISKSDDKTNPLKAELDENHKITGNAVLTDEKTKTTRVLNDSQLSSYLKKAVVDFVVSKHTSKKEIKIFLNKIENAYENFNSFREFYNQNLLEIIPSSYIKNIDTNYSNEEEIVCE